MEQTELFVLFTGDFTEAETSPDGLQSVLRRLAASFRVVTEHVAGNAAPDSQDACLETRPFIGVAESTREPIPEGFHLSLAPLPSPDAAIIAFWPDPGCGP
jgi:hypothetical protein